MRLEGSEGQSEPKWGWVSSSAAGARVCPGKLCRHRQHKDLCVKLLFSVTRKPPVLDPLPYIPLTYLCQFLLE